MLLIYHLVTAGASILSPFRVDPGVAYRGDDRTIHACERSLRNGGRSRRRPAAFTGAGLCVWRSSSVAGRLPVAAAATASS